MWIAGDNAPPGVNLAGGTGADEAAFGRFFSCSLHCWILQPSFIIANLVSTAAPVGPAWQGG
jgi:hypothetical protein